MSDTPIAFPKHLHVCCLCGKLFNGYGNDPWPVKNWPQKETDVCCDDCNTTQVIPARLKLRSKQRF